jgi:DNA-binding winged helix-turn-helix (wHTH) protein
MDSGPPVPTRIAFLDFELLPAQRLLLCAGRPLPVGARAYDLLVLLASRPGEIVSKGALMAGVWPHTVVDEANLRVQIAALRKLLGDAGSAIVNVAGRGYVFTAVPVPEARQAAAPARASAHLPSTPAQAPAGATASCSASMVAGLVRCTSKPAASARATSACWP